MLLLVVEVVEVEVVIMTQYKMVQAQVVEEEDKY